MIQYDYVCGRCATRHDERAYGPGYAKVCPVCGSYDQHLSKEAKERIAARIFRSQSARDVQAALVKGSTYGDESYCDYLDASAQEHYDYFMAHGDKATAESMFTRSLSESLRGNDGD